MPEQKPRPTNALKAIFGDSFAANIMLVFLENPDKEYFNKTEIAEELGIDPDTVRNNEEVLRRLETEDAIEKEGRRYRLEHDNHLTTLIKSLYTYDMKDDDV